MLAVSVVGLMGQFLPGVIPRRSSGAGMWLSEELRDVITSKWSLGSNRRAAEDLSAGSTGPKQRRAEV